MSLGIHKLAGPCNCRTCRNERFAKGLKETPLFKAAAKRESEREEAREQYDDTRDYDILFGPGSE